MDLPPQVRRLVSLDVEGNEIIHPDPTRHLPSNPPAARLPHGTLGGPTRCQHPSRLDLCRDSACAALVHST